MQFVNPPPRFPIVKMQSCRRIGILVVPYRHGEELTIRTFRIDGELRGDYGGHFVSGDERLCHDIEEPQVQKAVTFRGGRVENIYIKDDRKYFRSLVQQAENS